MKKLKQKDAIQGAVSNREDDCPILKWKYQRNEKTGKEELHSIQLSDGSKLNPESLKKALKKSSGTSNPIIGERILNKIALALSANREESKMNEVSALAAMEPQSETEALILGQFLTLQDSGMKCLHLANLPEQSFYHIERLLALAQKLLNTANLTMQTLVKYRTKGQQTMQVIHVHNEGQAIVAQNLSSKSALKRG